MSRPSPSAAAVLPEADADAGSEAGAEAAAEELDEPLPEQAAKLSAIAAAKNRLAILFIFYHLFLFYPLWDSL